MTSRILSCAILALSLLGIASAHAGSADATNAEGDTMRFEYRGDMLRVGVGGESASYMVMRDGNIYVVSNDGDQPMVINASQAMSMFGGMAGAATPDMVANEVVSLKNTGRKEQHAGITGEVWELVFRAEDGSEQRAELVLSDDPAALAFRDAMHNFATGVSETVGEDYKAATDDMQGRLSAMNKGVLRYGDDMRITALSLEAVDAARFDLPAEPMDLSNLGALMGAGQPAGSADEANESTGGPISSFLGALGRTGEEGDSAEDAAEEEAGGVGEQMGKAFDKLFGN
jgi:hypothetical protein